MLELPPSVHCSRTCSWLTFWHIYYLRIFVISYVIFFFSRIVEFNLNFYSFKSSMTCVKKRSTPTHQSNKGYTLLFWLIQCNHINEIPYRPDRWPSLRAGNDLLNKGNSTSGEDTTYWNKGIGGSLPSDGSTAPGMGYTGRRADLTGQTRWARLI